VADRTDGLAAAEEVRNKIDHPLVAAQRVGVVETAGNKECVIVVGAPSRQRNVHIHRLSRLQVTIAAHCPRLQPDDMDRRSRLLQRRARLRQFDLFKSVRRDDRNLLSRQFARHSAFPVPSGAGQCQRRRNIHQALQFRRPEHAAGSRTDRQEERSSARVGAGSTMRRPPGTTSIMARPRSAVPSGRKRK